VKRRPGDHGSVARGRLGLDVVVIAAGTAVALALGALTLRRRTA